MAIVYKSRVFSVEEARRRFPNGQEHAIVVVRHAPSVVLIPVEADGRIVLIRQYRASVDRELWEFPAGRVDEGEAPEAAARRECEEEIVRVPARLERLGAFYPTRDAGARRDHRSEDGVRSVAALTASPIVAQWIATVSSTRRA